MNEPSWETLIERSLGADATPGDWEELEGKADADPSRWKEFALAARDQIALAYAVNRVEKRASERELGALVVGVPVPRSRLRVPWGGWAVAAAIALLWIGTSLLGEHPRMLRTDSSPDEVLDLYRRAGAREGQLVKELPLVFLDSRTLGTGEGIEVVFLRQLLERRTVRGILEPGTDEWGRPVAVPVANAPSLLDEL